MDDGEVELSDPSLLPNTSSSNNNNTLRGSEPLDSILDEFLKHTRSTCTHTHTCNPPGPDTTHTHTCYHTHTQVFSSGSEEGTKTSSLKRRKPLGNREAVRKYREKKKAHTAYLEEEVKKLRGMNQQLARRLQGQAALEAELMRLRMLLGEIKGKIDVELGSFSFGKYCGSENGIGLMCEGPIPCFQSMEDGGVEGGDKGGFSWGGDCCEPVIVDCHVNGTCSDHQLVAAENQGQ